MKTPSFMKTVKHTFLTSRSFRKGLILLVLTVSAFIFTQCGSDDIAPKPTPEPPKPTDVYVAGRFFNGTNYVPVYWKNGETVTLSEVAGEADAIAVVGENVYVIGDLDDGTDKKRLWTNGVMSDFSDGADNTYTYVYSMRVVGNDWYAVGLYTDLNGDHAAYWKNGIVHIIETEYDARAYDIAIDDDDVYVVGFERNIDGLTVATVWKNDEGTGLTDGSSYADADGVTILDGDVYISGSENSTLKMWKNGIVTTLGTEGHSYTYCSSIAVHKGDVYVVGFEDNGNEYEAKYWKNGDEIPLPKPSSAPYATSFLMAISGDDIVFLGDTYVDGGYRALVWKNFELVAPFDGTEVWYGTGLAAR